MDPYVEKISGMVDDYTRRAAEADGVESTTFYGHQAMLKVLFAIFNQLTDILAELKKRN